MKTLLVTIAPKTTRYIGINITKNVKDLYGKNFRSPKKEIEKTLEHGNVFCS